MRSKEDRFSDLEREEEQYIDYVNLNSIRIWDAILKNGGSLSFDEFIDLFDE